MAQKYDFFSKKQLFDKKKQKKCDIFLFINEKLYICSPLERKNELFILKKF